MAILIRPATASRGVPSQVTIVPSELAALSVVPAGYYKNTNNWKEVRVKYQHDGSKQRTIVVFNGQETGTFLVSSSSRLGTWALESIVIKDYDGGEVFIGRSDIPSDESFDIVTTVASTHGDIYVGNGQLVQIPSNGKRQYGSLVVEAGGTLEVANGGGILELEVLGPCRIDGVIKGTSGNHSGGTWNSVTGLSESISYTITQGAGGNGGAGEGVNIIQFSKSYLFTHRNPPIKSTGGVEELVYMSGAGTVKEMTLVQFNSIAIGDTVSFDDGSTSVTAMVTGKYNDSNSLFYIGINKTLDSLAIEANLPGQDWANFTSWSFCKSTKGLGASGALLGNGGGGGRSGRFGALDGSAATQYQAGLGAGQDDAVAEAYGEDGANSATESEAGSGGFRGSHGQALYLKAERIDGAGVLNFSGSKGGNGGDGAEYLSGGILYANGAGGGGAGGSGGAVWLRYKKGTPALTINVAAGERGSAGANMPDAGQATHGDMGSAGFVSIEQIL